MSNEILDKVRKVAQDLRDEAAKAIDHDESVGARDTTTDSWDAQMITADIILRVIREG